MFFDMKKHCIFVIQKWTVNRCIYLRVVHETQRRMFFHGINNERMLRFIFYQSNCSNSWKQEDCAHQPQKVFWFWNVNVQEREQYYHIQQIHFCLRNLYFFDERERQFVNEINELICCKNQIVKYVSDYAKHKRNFAQQKQQHSRIQNKITDWNDDKIWQQK